MNRSGYYNPILAYGEAKAIQDARAAGANGFIVVDLPPEEAVKFRETCAANRCVVLRPHSGGLFMLTNHLKRISYVPLLAPSTSPGRIKFLTSIADSFIYVVSRVRRIFRA